MRFWVLGVETSFVTLGNEGVSLLIPFSIVVVCLIIIMLFEQTFRFWIWFDTTLPGPEDNYICYIIIILVFLFYEVLLFYFIIILAIFPLNGKQYFYGFLGGFWVFFSFKRSFLNDLWVISWKVINIQYFFFTAKTSFVLIWLV